MVMTSRMRESNLGEGEGTSQPSNGPAYAGVKPSVSRSPKARLVTVSRMRESNQPRDAASVNQPSDPAYAGVKPT